MKAMVFPGQGAQYRGMGKKRFAEFPDIVAQANDILGYDVETLCVSDPDKRLNFTQYTQPALFTVSVMEYLALKQLDQHHCDFLAGHSLGEYTALWASGAFDFATGLQLVAKRGQLMGQAQGGGMLAVLGISSEQVQVLLQQQDLGQLAIANYNTPTQTIVSGPEAQIRRGLDIFEQQGIKAVALNVKGAFHSYLMNDARAAFEQTIGSFEFNDLTTPVIANVNARPYQSGTVKSLLAEQLSSPVLWCDSIRYLMGQQVSEFHECSTRATLSKMITEIRQNCTPIEHPVAAVERPTQNIAPAPGPTPTQIPVPTHNAQSAPSDPAANSVLCATSLGSPQFKRDYGVKYAYVAGSMYRGISSKAMVVTMGKSGFIGFLGSGGMSLSQIAENVAYIQQQLGVDGSYGVNLLCNLNNPPMELDTVKLLLERKVKHIEASAFVTITPALVLYRVSGLSKNADGQVVCNHRIMAKLSRPEVALAFMSPPPLAMVEQLVEQGSITPEQASLSQHVPMSHEICVETDSGGHTDMGIPSVLFPAIKYQQQQLSANYRYNKPILVGLAGGIGSPVAAAAAFFMGADFIVTGSINQCTVQSGASDIVKTLLQDIGIQDTDYAPAGDMFEIGAKVQILKKGTFFWCQSQQIVSGLHPF